MTKKTIKPASQWNAFTFYAEDAKEVFTQVKLPSGMKLRLQGYTEIETGAGIVELAKSQELKEIDMSAPKSEQENGGTAQRKIKGVPLGKLVAGMRLEYGIESEPRKPKLAESTEPKMATA